MARSPARGVRRPIEKYFGRASARSARPSAPALLSTEDFISYTHPSVGLHYVISRPTSRP